LICCFTLRFTLFGYLRLVGCYVVVVVPTCGYVWLRLRFTLLLRLRSLDVHVVVRCVTFTVVIRYGLVDWLRTTVVIWLPVVTVVCGYGWFGSCWFTLLLLVYTVIVVPVVYVIVTVVADVVGCYTRVYVALVVTHVGYVYVTWLFYTLRCGYVVYTVRLVTTTFTVGCVAAVGCTLLTFTHGCGWFPLWLLLLHTLPVRLLLRWFDVARLRAVTFWLRYVVALYVTRYVTFTLLVVPVVGCCDTVYVCGCYVGLLFVAVGLRYVVTGRLRCTVVCCGCRLVVVPVGCWLVVRLRCWLLPRCAFVYVVYVGSVTDLHLLRVRLRYRLFTRVRYGLRLILPRWLLRLRYVC